MRKFVVWALLSVPAIILLYRFAIDAIGYGETIHQSGQWSVALLIVAMSVSPLQRVFRHSAWVRFLIFHRRAIGVASFAYAALHTAVYVERKWGAGLILKESLEPSIGTGWLALFIFSVLALTSNNASVRALRQRWKRLHRSIYLAAGLTFAHWILATFDPLAAYISLALLLLIEALRLVGKKVTVKPHNAP